MGFPSGPSHDHGERAVALLATEREFYGKQIWLFQCAGSASARAAQPSILAVGHLRASEVLNGRTNDGGVCGSAATTARCICCAVKGRGAAVAGGEWRAPEEP
jgi:hypothetical protein